MSNEMIKMESIEKRTKREFHYFILTDYEREEEYLRHMHNQGWRLVKVTLPGVYHFEQCEPEDVIYRLDFSPEKKDNLNQYVQMYRDYGWEYLQDLNEYSYFRKKADVIDKKKDEIFSDNASRLAMLQNVIKHRMIPIFSVFLLIVIPQFLNVFFLTPQQTGGFHFFMGFLVFWCAMLAMYAYILVRCLVDVSRLKKKYS